MSSSPEDPWRYPSPPPYPYPYGQFDPYRTQLAPPATQLPSWSPTVGWRLAHSAWLLLPLLGCGCLGSFGLLYVGIRARRKAWWIPAIGYFALSVAAFVVINMVDAESPLADVGVSLLLASWLACLLHSCLVHSSWLGWLADDRRRSMLATAWPVVAYQPISMSAPPVHPLLQGADLPSPDAYYATAPHPAAPNPTPEPGAMGPAPEPAGEAAPEARGTPATEQTPLDVNTATVDQLAALPGFDARRAARADTERSARGGFATTSQFAEAAGLQPHEYARVRRLVMCDPPSSPPPPTSQGRILDV